MAEAENPPVIMFKAPRVRVCVSVERRWLYRDKRKRTITRVYTVRLVGADRRDAWRGLKILNRNSIQPLLKPPLGQPCLITWLMQCEWELLKIYKGKAKLIYRSRALDFHAPIAHSFRSPHHRIRNIRHRAKCAGMYWNASIMPSMFDCFRHTFDSLALCSVESWIYDGSCRDHAVNDE